MRITRGSPEAAKRNREEGWQEKTPNHREQKKSSNQLNSTIIIVDTRAHTCAGVAAALSPSPASVENAQNVRLPVGEKVSQDEA